MSDWRGLAILAFSVGVPLLLLLQRRERELLAWVCLTVGVSVFDARVGINFPAARLVGLTALPFMALGAFRFQALLRTTAFRLLLAQAAYLVLLGFIFGFLYPWEISGFSRGWSQGAAGRVLIYLVRMLADLGVLLFVAKQIGDGVRPSTVVKFLLAGTTIAALGGLAEFLTHVQLYQTLTGYPIQEVAGRVRGLNYEPRVLGLAVAHGMFLSLLWYAFTRRAAALWLAVLHGLVLILSVSSSALLAALTMAFALLAVEPRLRRPALGMAAVSVIAAILVLSSGQSPLTELWSSSLLQRFSLEEVSRLSPESRLQALSLLLDIFDLTAVGALMAYPLVAAIGAGPGLIVLPGSLFIPDLARWSWVVASGEGITSLPSMGVVLEWSNGGVVGVVLWVALVVAVLRCLGRLMREGGADAGEWRLARGTFVAGASAYFAQVSPLSAIWPVILGLGIGACLVAHERRSTPADG